MILALAALFLAALVLWFLLRTRDPPHGGWSQWLTSSAYHNSTAQHTHCPVLTRCSTQVVSRVPLHPVSGLHLAVCQRAT